MSAEQGNYTAHFRRADDARQSVTDHCRAVGRLCGEFASSMQMHALGTLAGLLHDMGKFSDAFQIYIEDSIRKEKAGLPHAAGSVDHGKDGATWVMERYHRGDEAAQCAAETLALAIAWHHGGLQDFINPEAANVSHRIPLLLRCDPDEQYRQSSQRFCAQAVSPEKLDALFAQAAAEIDAYLVRFRQEPRARKMFLMHLLIKQLYSCLVDADRFQTFLFASSQCPALPANTQALWAQYEALVREKQNRFRAEHCSSETAENIRRLRCEIADCCVSFASRETGIYTLTVPTGGGKTLSSLWYALEHAKKYEKKRIVYIIPYTSIIEQNARTVRELLGCGDELLEHHSHMLLEDLEDPENLGQSEQMDPSAFAARKLLSERWNAPIIFTTMVQFLETVYARGTQKIRRFHHLSDAVLIFDEVQSTPTRCLSLFNECLYYLKTYANSTCVLCSATQPALDLAKRPLMPDAEMIPDLASKFAAFRRMEVKNRMRSPATPDSLAEQAAGLVLEAGSVLIITNTTAQAADIFRAVESLVLSETEVFYLSTHLCPAHRQEVLSDIKKRLAAGQRTVCVSTRLIEAGVDISFGTVIRLLAGLDSIAQAAGRGNRHGKAALAQTWVVKPEHENLDHMPDVAVGIRHSEGILQSIADNPQRFAGDPLSPAAMREYYQYYFDDGDIQKQMDYPSGQTTLFDLLRGAGVRAAYRNASPDSGCPLRLGIRFRTAAEAFRVIDDDTRAVVVPHGTGRELTDRWLSDCPIEERQRLLRGMQGFSVNLLNYQLRALESGGALTEYGGVLFLRGEYYDAALGVVLRGAHMDFLQA